MAEGGSGIWTPPGGSADPRRREPSEPEPGEAGEKELADVVEQVKRLRVADVLLSTLATLAQLAYAKLDPETRDLEQARLAIDALASLARVLEGAVPAETLRDFGQVVANLQLAYASAAGEASPAEDG